MRRPVLTIAALTVWLPALVAAPPPVWAQTSPDEAIRRLDVEREAEALRAAELAAKAEAEREAAAQLQAALVQAAAAQRESERRASAIEVRLEELIDSEAVLLGRLSERREQLSELLGALMALEKQDAPAIAISPEDAAAAVRAAILMGEAAPALRDRALELTRQLRALREVRAGIEAERADLAETEARLAERAQQLQVLVDERSARAENLRAEAQAAAERAEALGEEAASLRNLIEELARQAIANAAKAAAPIAFSRAKGLLLAPVTGSIAIPFGDAPMEILEKGVTFRARSAAVVVAPFDGVVEFARPFKDYGQLMIMNVGDDHHVVLAGFARLDVQEGQAVLAGEPLGVMATQTGGVAQTGGAANVDADSLKRGAALYMEIRRRGAPIDPGPWLARQD